MKRFALIPLLLLLFTLSGCGVTEHQVTLELGDNIVFETVSVKDQEKLVLPDNPIKEGYTFEAWYLDEEFTSVYDNNSLVTEDITLYASWSPVRTTISLHDEDILIAEFYLEYGDTVTLPLAEKTGYTFVGWYEEVSYENVAIEVSGSLEDKSYYAAFTKNAMLLPEEEVANLTALPYYSYLSESNPVITITVEGIGIMKVELFPEVAKNTVDNLLTYVLSDSYTDSTFHRIIENFMIQGGIVAETDSPIKGEFSSNGVENELSHYRGVISMARTVIKNSATSQFFIVHQDALGLDGNYATFGGLIGGFNVLDYLATVSTDYNDKPTNDMVIESITVELNGYVVSDPVSAFE